MEGSNKKLNIMGLWKDAPCTSKNTVLPIALSLF